MNYKSIWKTLRGVLELHKRLAAKFKDNESFKGIKPIIEAKIEYMETLEKLMDDLERDMIGIELDNMEKDNKGEKCK